MKISEVTLQDLESLKDLQPEGWPDIIPHFNFYISSGFCSPIKMSDGDNTLAIGTAIFHRSSAWLAHIIVNKNYRNNGYGTKITDALLQRIDKNRCPSISLIATELGAPVYKKFGFEQITEYNFFRSDTPHSCELEHNVFKPVGNVFFNEILDLDRKISGEDRHQLVTLHLPNAIVYCESNTLLGFYLPTLNEGLVVANNTIAGIGLLKYRMKERTVSIVPKENESATQFLEANNFQNYQKGTRMALGKKLNFRGELLFNRISGGLG
ncbi:MAG TPA: GNAT family N-acetyltransferase [Cytophagaceae bacterium]|jgi:GNAT superfamily N-acetyltransferase